MLHEDNSALQRVYDHPKADTEGAGFYRGNGPTSWFVATSFCAAFGGALGALIGSIWGLGLAGFIGGSMFGFAARTAWVLFAAAPQQDEFSGGNARTEEEVRQALAEIKAREK